MPILLTAMPSVGYRKSPELPAFSPPAKTYYSKKIKYTLKVLLLKNKKNKKDCGSLSELVFANVSLEKQLKLKAASMFVHGSDKLASMQFNSEEKKQTLNILFQCRM